MFNEPLSTIFDESLMEDVLAGIIAEDTSARAIRSIDNTHETDALVRLSRHEYESYNRLTFYINKNTCLKGKITNKLSETKDKIILVIVGKKKGEAGNIETRLFFVNESFDKGRWRKTDEFVEEFHLYNFISNNKQYTLLSKEELLLQEYTIYGTAFEKEDSKLIGQSSRIPTKTTLVFVHSAYERIIKYKDHFELMDAVKPLILDRNKLFNFLFSAKGYSYRHPPYFESLIGGFLFAAPVDGYPLHLLINGKPGAGKTTVSETLHTKFLEDQGIVEGSGSTIKSLIPSFKNTTAEPGSLLKSNRIGIVDEFLRILMRVAKEDRESQLSMLNPLMEHKEREFGSGNCRIKAKMTAKLFAVTNPVWGTKTMPSLCEQIDKSFVSRQLVFYQTEDHVNLVQSREGKEKTQFTIDLQTWLSIYDYMQIFCCTFDEERVLEVYKTALALLGEDTKENPLQAVIEVYAARYQHHIFCLMDGLVKLRCLCNSDGTFTATEEDYQELRRVWLKMIEGWDIGVKGLLKY